MKYHPQTAECLKGNGLFKTFVVVIVVVGVVVVVVVLVLVLVLVLVVVYLLLVYIRQMIERVYPIYDPCKVYLPRLTTKKSTIHVGKYLSVPLIL